MSQSFEIYSVSNIVNKRKKGMDLTEAEDIKKKWQEYTELYKKDLHDPDNHDGVSGVITRARHLGM